MQMHIGDRTLEGASLTVNICKAIPPKFRIDTREITDVFVPSDQRKTGLGTALMHSICDEADACHITLLLTCSNELRRWYAKFGFMVLQDDIGMLVRMPGSTPHMLTPTARAAAHSLPIAH